MFVLIQNILCLLCCKLISLPLFISLLFFCVGQHGGGQVFKTLQWLVRSIDEERISVGALVAEDKPCISRHLKYCASERGIPIMVSL